MPPAPAALAAGDLAARRQALHLAVGDVAQRLKLAPRQIEALEGGNWAALPGAAFVRGALRAYGRLLGIDVSALLGQVGGHDEPLRPGMSLREPLPRRGVSTPKPRARGRLAGLLRVALGLAVLAALALFFGRSDDLSEIRSWIDAPPGATEPAASAAPADAQPEGVRVPGAGGAAAAGAPGLPTDPSVTPPPLVPNAPAPSAATGNSRP